MMNCRFCMSLILGVAMIVGAGLVSAQEPPPPPGADVMFHGGVPGGEFMGPPMGERIELLGFEGMHGGKVVTGAPFSAVAISETSRTLAEGSDVARHRTTGDYRGNGVVCHDRRSGGEHAFHPARRHKDGRANEEALSSDERPGEWCDEGCDQGQD